MNMIGIPS